MVKRILIVSGLIWAFLTGMAWQAKGPCWLKPPFECPVREEETTIQP